MKKTWKLALASVALVSGVAFTACSSDDEELLGGNETTAPVGGETGEVKTQITFAIPHAKVQRSTADYVQEDQNFNGMTNIYLLPFKVGAVGETVDAGDTFLGTMVNLGNIASDEITSTNGVKTYSQVSLPYGNVSFLLYGETQATGNGKLTPSYTTANPIDASYTPNDISFTLTDIETPDLTALANVLVELRNILHTNWGTTASESAMKENVAKLTGKFSVAEVQLTTMLNNLASALDLEADKHDADTKIEAVRTAMESVYGSNYKLPTAVYVFDWSQGGATDITMDDQVVNNGSTLSYPPSLYYSTNSVPVDYSGDSFEGNAIAIDATTTSVALKSSVNYAVGRLDVKVKADAASLDDNNNDADAPAIDVDKLTLTGVIVGSQPGSVGYNFVNNTTDWNHMIYDNEVVDATLSTTSALKTYVLGLPSQVYVDAGSTAATVRIALEFVNNGAAIYGINGGVIPTGATFYLVGSLNPNVSGTPSGPKQVFASDYFTTANITINNLKSAYATLPDLTNPQLEFALKVDLTWKQGISMDAEIGE